MTIKKFSTDEMDILDDVKELFNLYITLSQNHNKIFSLDKNIHNEWLDIGIKIVDLKTKFYRMSISEEMQLKVTKDSTDEKSTHCQTDMVNERLLKEKIMELLETRKDVNPLSGRKFNIDEKKAEHVTVIDDGDWASCPYCAMFRDIGTIVCPNCGRTLFQEKNGVS